MILARWVETVRRLRPSQVGSRLRRRVRGTKPPPAGRLPSWASIAPLPREARRPTAFPWDGPRGDAWAFAGSLARFDAAGGLSWEGEPTLLARHHAASGEHVRALAEAGDVATAAARWPAALSACEPHPHVRARRVLAAAEARVLGVEAADPRPDAAALARDLEWDVRGNHLVADATALYRCGHACRGGEAAAWRATGASVLSSCVREQVLADGVHYERSPVYHAIVLEHLLVSLETAAAAGTAPPPRVEDAARRMAVALAELRLPDGLAPRWRDGAPGMALPTDALLAWAARRAGPLSPPRCGTRLFPAAGLAVLESEDGRHAATLSASPPCPPDLPAHGHADALAYEAVLGGRRVVASSGTASYAEGPERDRDRLPGAFAGVLVDGRAPADPWASFRIGRRGWVKGLEAGSGDGFSWAAAASGGFSSRGRRLVHRRTLVLFDAGAVAVVDEWAGRAALAVDAFVPFGPGEEPSVAAPGATVVLEAGSFARALGASEERGVARLSWRVEAPSRTVHAVGPAGAPLRAGGDVVAGGGFRVSVEGVGTRPLVAVVPCGVPP